MPPESPEPNQESTGSPPEQTQSPAEASQPSAPSVGKKKPLLIILIVILVLLLAFGGYKLFFAKDDDSSQASTQSSQQDEDTQDQAEDLPAAACADGLAEFEGDNIGLHFCYPAAWGASGIDDAKLDPSDTGSRYLVSFARNEQAHVMLVSSDWTTTVGRGGSCLDGGSSAPDYSAFDENWTNEPGFASRGLAMEANKYLIREDASDFLGGVCLSGVAELQDSRYDVATASYFASFPEGSGESAISHHVNSPNVLISATDREAFVELVKSIR